MATSAAALAQPVPTSPARQPALDWMRGLVIILMAIDHASTAFNAGRLMADSPWVYRPGVELPLDQFLTRWITHLCAPTFVFLAGAAVALSAARREAAGEPRRAMDRYLLLRGLLIAALDPLWMSLAFTPGRILLQVLYAIGMSFVCMTFLRRLSNGWLVPLALALIVGGEAIGGIVGRPADLATALLLTGGRFGGVLICGYPLLPWLAVMMLGWAFGRRLASAPTWKPERLLVLAGVVALAVFLVVRGIDGYGNMGLPRDEQTLVRWLNVSKYPPSWSYQALELGLMTLCLAGFFALGRRSTHRLEVLLVPGQTAFLFYLLHAHLLKLAAWMTGTTKSLGIWAAYVGAAGVIALLFPLCVWYRGYKRRHPDGWTRYL